MDIFSEIYRATQETAKPTQGQADAGNYRKGRVPVHGLKIAIETPRGQYREGVGKDGKPWSSLMKATYGHFEGFIGADGDGVDVFIGECPENDTAWIVNQQNPDTKSFDEHKVMLGFVDKESAVHAYEKSYEQGWKGLQSVIECDISQLADWLKNADKKIPVTQLPYLAGANMKNDLSLDSVTAADIIEASDGAMAFDALVIPYQRIERKMSQMMGIMKMAANGDVRPIAMQVTDPFRQKGTTNIAVVFEMSDGQTVSIFFHNPDVTPNKIKPTDDLVSWKWMLNKKDVTIVVAPEKGQDLNPRLVARRIIALAEKNSERFKMANADKASRMETLEAAKTDLEEKTGILEALNIEIAELEAKAVASTSKPFIETGDSRETSKEIMEAIYFVAGNSDSVAERIWQSPTDAELIAIYERVTKNGLVDATDLFWGANGNDWLPNAEKSNERFSKLNLDPNDNSRAANYIRKWGEYSFGEKEQADSYAKLLMSGEGGLWRAENDGHGWRAHKVSSLEEPLFEEWSAASEYAYQAAKKSGYGALENEFGNMSIAKWQDIFSSPDELKQYADMKIDSYFLGRSKSGEENFYDKTITDKLAALDAKYKDGEMAAMVLAAKKAAKDFLIAEFKKKVS